LKLKVIQDQLLAIGREVIKEDLLLIILKSLPPSFEYFVEMLHVTSMSTIISLRSCALSYQRKTSGRCSLEAAMVVEHSREPSQQSLKAKKRRRMVAKTI
jgi:hypothetical protein